MKAAVEKEASSRLLVRQLMLNVTILQSVFSGSGDTFGENCKVALGGCNSAMHCVGS